MCSTAVAGSLSRTDRLGVLRSPEIGVVRRRGRAGRVHAANPRLLQRARSLDHHQGRSACASASARQYRLCRRQIVRRHGPNSPANCASSACSHPRPIRSARRNPVAAAQSLRRSSRCGLIPSSHSGKALENVLEHFPRDELFQIDERDAWHIRARHIAARRASADPALRAPRPFRPLRLGASSSSRATASTATARAIGAACQGL